MSVAEWHRRSVERFLELTQQVTEPQWGSPTPCADWNVRQLVNHMV